MTNIGLTIFVFIVFVAFVFFIYTAIDGFNMFRKNTKPKVIKFENDTYGIMKIKHGKELFLSLSSSYIFDSWHDRLSVCFHECQSSKEKAIEVMKIRTLKIVEFYD